MARRVYQVKQPSILGNIGLEATLKVAGSVVLQRHVRLLSLLSRISNCYYTFIKLQLEASL